MAAIDAASLHALDDYFQSTPIGSIERAIGNNLYGINHRQVAGMVPMNKDAYGLTFFVRPQLNLQSNNIRNNRLLYPLLTENETSLQRFARCSLDPRLLHGYGGTNNSVAALKCPIVDNEQAFMPILTNNLNSISGWPDIVSPTFSSKPGLLNEVYSQVDGTTKNYEAFDITASFRNTKGDPIVYAFYIWLHYQSSVFVGDMVPYPDFITENEIDYNTRIYRLVLDSEKLYVKKIAACGAAFPMSVPTGSFFDYSSEKPYNDQNKDISVMFRCMGAIYQDDILIKEFNDTVCVFNPAMTNKRRDQDMVQVKQNLVGYFNNRGYARINPNNYQLEWWVPRALFQARVDAFLQTNLGDTAAMDANETGD